MEDKVEDKTELELEEEDETEDPYIGAGELEDTDVDGIEDELWAEAINQLMNQDEESVKVPKND